MLCICLDGRGGLQSDGSGLNSLGALLALQKHLKHELNDYVESCVYFAVAIHVHTARLGEGCAG